MENRQTNDKLKKRMIIMLIGVGILFGGIFIYKFIIQLVIKYAIAHQPKVVTVSTMKAHYSDWSSQLKAVGSLRAVRGVNVTTQAGGMVRTIFFKPGSMVSEDTVLVELNIDSDVAQLHALQASEELANITYLRDKKQFAATAISKQTLDADAANLKNLQAQVAQQLATVAKKIIRAPFSGRLGISAVNPGQYINPGDKVVTLQQLDPIYVDFYVPQQLQSELKNGQTVTITSDAFPGKNFSGTITTIDPLVDTTTRNTEIEATVANPNFELLPGMFANITVTTGNPQHFLTLPQTAITFNPYGSSIFTVKKDKDKLIAIQSFVTTGETRGEQITILKGLQEGDEVVTSGQLKLKNGIAVAVNNNVAPPDNPAPVLPNEH